MKLYVHEFGFSTNHTCRATLLLIFLYKSKEYRRIRPLLSSLSGAGGGRVKIEEAKPFPSFSLSHPISQSLWIRHVF
jgi:hypothetical protein